MAGTVPIAETNSTLEDEDFYLRIINVPEFWLTLAVVGFAMSAVIVVSNGFLLFVIYKDPRQAFRTPPNFLIANLSASEFLLGILVVFFVALRDLFRYLKVAIPYVRVLKDIVYIVISTTLFVGSATIVAMSLTCYFAINKPLVYKTRLTTRRIKTLIALIWIVALLMSFLPASNLPERTYTLVSLHTHVSLPAILLLVMYIKVFRALSRRTLEVSRSFKEPGMERRRTLARERNMAITIVTILALFFITYLPKYTSLHLLYFCKTCQDSVTFYQIDVVFSRFLFVSSAIDPFFYAWRFKKYRRAVRDSWKILINSQNSRVTSGQTGGTLFSRRNTKSSNSQVLRLPLFKRIDFRKFSLV